MFMTLQLYLKIARRIASDFFTYLHIELHNNKRIDAGSPCQQALEIRSNNLGAVLLKDYPRLFSETNGNVSIDDNTLVKKHKDVVLFCITGCYFVLFQSGRSPPRTNPVFFSWTISSKLQS